MAGALEGVRVVDLSRVLGGPYATQILGDHGADVVKIEPPTGDETRDWGPPFRDGVSAYFTGVNRSKRGMALDVAHPEGRAVLLRLLAQADVVIENFKPGTMEKWGLGYQEVLRERFPRLIHCSLTGFGPDGPFGAFPGYDLMVQAWVGLVSVNGSAESGPLRLGIPLIDMATGMNAVLGVLMALRKRDQTGRGQHVDVSLFDTGLSLMHPHAANWFMAGQDSALTGNAHPSIAPYSLHATSGRSLFLGAGNDRQFRKLCEILGRPDLAQDPRFLKNKDRVANRGALTTALEEAMAGRDGEELALELMRQGVPAGAVLSAGEAMEHAHAAHRGMAAAVEDYRGTGIPVKLSDTPGAVRTKPPAFNADGERVLRDCGFTADEITALREAGVLVSERRKL